MAAFGADRASECVGVCAEEAVDEEGGGSSAVERYHALVFGVGESYASECGAECLTVVGDGQDVVLNRGLDRKGVERVWSILFGGIGGVIGLWITRVRGNDGRVWSALGGGPKESMQGLVDLGD